MVIGLQQIFEEDLTLPLYFDATPFNPISVCDKHNWSKTLNFHVSEKLFLGEKFISEDTGPP